MSGIEIRPVQSSRELDEFITLPKALHAGDPAFIAPLRLERRQALSAKHNPLLRKIEARFWTARRNGQPVGRISAQADPRQGEIGLFGFVAAQDDPEVFHALFRTAERWLASRGKTEAQGPFHLNINEETGVLVDGFKTPPMLLMPHDLPYVAGRIEAEGYVKAMDMFAYLHDTQVPFPKSIDRLLKRPKPANVVIRHMDWSRYDDEIRTVVDIFNDAWSENWGFMPFGEDDLAHMAKSMKLLLDEKLLWFVEVDGRPAAFGLSLPNLNEMIRDLDGELFPLGWAKLLLRLKRRSYTSGRIPLMGVRKEHHKSYLGQLLPLYIFEKFREEGRARNVRHVEMSWVLETNKPMRHFGEALGSAYKTYRVYSKKIA